jgi:hypothetical protein
MDDPRAYDRTSLRPTPKFIGWWERLIGVTLKSIATGRDFGTSLEKTLVNCSAARGIGASSLQMKGAIGR